jgi:hypothetical protein
VSLPEIVKKKRLLILTPSMSLLLAACSGDAITPGGDSCAQIRNGVDRALCSEFAAIDHHPLTAGTDELCTRLSVDMLGRKPTPEEKSQCAQLDPADVVVAYQSLDTYRKAQRRRWADRFSYADGAVDPLAIKELDALVDRLYRGEKKYSEFAIEALAHPAFVGRNLAFGLPEEVARAAFRLFLGRVATRPEAQDLAPLWSAWIPGGAYRGIDVTGFPYGPIPYVDPAACEKGVRSCASTLVGRATVELEPNGRSGPIPTSALTDADWMQLRAPGRLITSLDIFWEAQVDEVLMHYLGYDLGALRPGVRDLLVGEFREHGSIVELERSVLTSVAYLQTAVVDPARQVPEQIRNLPLAHGPSKLMTPEAWLHSLGTAIGYNVGDCDFRYPQLPSAMLIDPYTGREIDLSELDDFWPRKSDGSVDTSFRDLALSMGGCPGSFDPFTFTITTRSSHLGLIAAVGQEEAALSLCIDSPATGLIPGNVDRADASADARAAAVKHVLTRMFGGASDDDVAEAVAAANAGCAGCSAEQVARQLCSGVSAGVEYIFH